MDRLRRFAVEREPAQGGHRDLESAGDVGRRRKHGEPGLLERFDVAPSIAELAREASAEKDDVFGPSFCDRCAELGASRRRDLLLRRLLFELLSLQRVEIEL